MTQFFVMVKCMVCRVFLYTGDNNKIKKYTQFQSSRINNEENEKSGLFIYKKKKIAALTNMLAAGI